MTVLDLREVGSETCPTISSMAIEARLSTRAQATPNRGLLWLPSWRRAGAVDVRSVEHMAVLASMLSRTNFAGIEAGTPDNRRWAQVARHDPDGRSKPGFIVELSDCAIQVVVGNAAGLDPAELNEVTRAKSRADVSVVRYFETETHWRSTEVADIVQRWVAFGHLPKPPVHYTRVIWRTNDC